jgi:hypothetical protein
VSLGEGTITVRLHSDDEGGRRRFNRTENVRPIPTTDPDFARLYRWRNDAESINRALDDTLWLRRAHSAAEEFVLSRDPRVLPSFRPILERSCLTAAAHTAGIVASTGLHRLTILTAGCPVPEPGAYDRADQILTEQEKA